MCCGQTAPQRQMSTHVPLKGVADYFTPDLEYEKPRVNPKDGFDFN